MTTPLDIVQANLKQSKQALENLLANPAALASVAAAAELIGAAFDRGGRVFSCGNGGSMCDAMHFAEELSGRYRNDRKALPAVSISDPSHISCVGNDYGYDFIFSRYLEAHARAGDVLLGISTSGKSANVIKAAEYAKAHGIHVVTLTGKPDSVLGGLATIDIVTPGNSGYADRVQELHIKVIHILIELVERRFFPENYEQ
ncbi:phosphoheptose isomerase [Betaproteobacteria bacterium UKL13-2]|jgi:D-sedoheptulose 7-phosphate isomerase|nr:phosphoheptose isomerase [Betaproteobacteria bacterium UKL13-2]HCG53313.1 phosphoheptose isomerase [Betaproteobacteria bacterium]